MNPSASEEKRSLWPFKRIHNWFAYQIDDQKPKGTIASLDGVRAIACIIVVIYHSTSLVYWHWDIDHKPLLAALNYTGARGVTLFFVLSGFLLFLPYAKALLFEKPWPQARMFYLRHILRIEYILVLTVSFTLYVLVEKPGMRLSERWRNKNRESHEQQNTARFVHTPVQHEDPNGEKIRSRQPTMLTR